MINLSKELDLTFIPKSETEYICEVEEETKIEEKETRIEKEEDTEILQSNDLLKNLENYELDISDDENHCYGTKNLIPKTITYTSVPGIVDSKRKKSEKLTENYSSNQYSSEEVGLEESYHIEEPHYHKRFTKKDTFLNNPLTFEDVNEVLNNSDSNDFPLSPLSIDSSLMTELSNPSDLTEFLDAFTNSPSDVFEGHFAETTDMKINLESKYGCRNKDREPQTHWDKINNFKITKTEKIGKVLNAVPKTYESFAKVPISEPEDYREIKYSSDENNSESTKTRELFNLLLQVNQFKQNIIHQLVLSQNHSGILVVLECLAEMKTLNVLLEAVDQFNNAPFAYAVIAGDVIMVELLLKFYPKIPRFCYFKSTNEWMPILQTAYQFIGDREGNLITLICNHILSVHNRETLKEILEAKNQFGLTIIHHIIVNYAPVSDSSMKNSQIYISNLLKVGASLETKCCCPSKKQIDVDALGQVLFSRYPLELLNLFMAYPFIKDVQFKWDYVIDNISYKLEELLQLRTDIDLACKRNVLKLLHKFL